MAKEAKSTPTEDAALQELMDAAKTKGATVLVIAPPRDGDPATPSDTAPSGTTTFLLTLQHLRVAIVELATDLPDHWRNLETEVETMADRGVIERTIHATKVALVANSVGFALMLCYMLWARPRMRALATRPAPERSDRIGLALARLALLLGYVVVFVVAGATASVAMSEDFFATERIFLIYQLPIAEMLVASIAIITVLAPNAPQSRLVPLADADARRLAFRLIALAVFAALASGLVAWIEIARMPRSLYRLAMLVALNGSCLALILIAHSLRGKAVRRPEKQAPVLVAESHEAAEAAELALSLEQEAEREATHIPASGFLADHWHRIAAAGVLIAAVLGSARVLLNRPEPISPIIGPFLVIAAGVLCYAVIVFIIDRTFQMLATRQVPVEPESKTADVAVSPDAPASFAETHQSLLAARRRARADRRVLASRRGIVRALFEHAVLILIIAAVISGILATWGIDVRDPEGPFARFAGLILVVFISIMAYRAVKLWLDEEIAIENFIAAEEMVRGESVSIVGATTRLGTLLMIVRNFMLAAIVLVALMIALDELGVNIAPLFAGAGVIGIAVGFGAQSLIKDMFSGMFYLIDDAFRTGEYIDIGTCKGTVEKISIRSFQLRHQNGPLNTVPFGDIKKLTNYSRDWVIVKLPIRVTYDTPVPKINQIIKKISKELLEDEDVGHLFLQPLKSQGVYEMDDSAMVVRVKFMTKPNEQFVVQRMVYARIRDEFLAAGIKFGHRNVTVFVANPDGTPAPNPERVAAAAGSALMPIIAEEEAAAAAEEDAETSNE